MQSATSSKRPHLAVGQFVMCVIFAVVLAGLCMLVDSWLEKNTVHFKIWGAVAGIILAVFVNIIIYILCNKKGWYRQRWAVMPYSNYLALVINIVCALVISSGKDVSGWDEAIAEFFRTPLLNWGLVIISVLWWRKVDKKILDDWA